MQRGEPGVVIDERAVDFHHPELRAEYPCLDEHGLGIDARLFVHRKESGILFVVETHHDGVRSLVGYGRFPAPVSSFFLLHLLAFCVARHEPSVRSSGVRHGLRHPDFGGMPAPRGARLSGVARKVSGYPIHTLLLAGANKNPSGTDCEGTSVDRHPDAAGAPCRSGAKIGRSGAGFMQAGRAMRRHRATNAATDGTDDTTDGISRFLCRRNDRTVVRRNK